MINQQAQQQVDSFFSWAFVKQELSYFPGRDNIVLRFIISASLVLIISSALEVPVMDYSILVVFVSTGANIVITKFLCPAVVFAHFIIVAVSILNIKLTIDYPLLRLLNTALILMISLYLYRIPSKFNVVFFLVSIFIVYSQSFIDSSPSGESVVRQLLWLVVAGAYPAVVVYFVNVIFLTIEPAKLFEGEIENTLNSVSKRLIKVANGAPIKAISISDIKNKNTVLNKNFNFAKAREQGYRDNEDTYLTGILTTEMLYHSTAQLHGLVANNSNNPLIAKHCRLLAKECQKFKQSFVEKKSYTLPVKNIDEIYELPECLQSMYHALLSTAINDEVEEETATDAKDVTSDKPTSESHKPFINLSYDNLRAGVKTLLSVAICYIFYTSVQWSGIHTSMLTCVILALPGVGASLHKALLRIVGCAIGSGLALFCTVFMLPHLETITGLILMSAPIFAIAGWVIAGSEKSSYAGLQIILAFSLAMYGEFSASPNIPEIRDRFVGILLGIFVSTLVSISLWPEKDGHKLRTSLVKLFEYLSTQLQKIKANRKSYILGWNQLDNTETLIMHVKLEPEWNNDIGLPDIGQKGQTLLTKLCELHMTLYKLQSDFTLLKNKYPDLDLIVLDNMMQVLSDTIHSYGQGLHQDPAQYIDIKQKILSSEAYQAFVKEHEAVLATGKTAEKIIMKHTQTLIDICCAIPPWDKLSSQG